MKRSDVASVDLTSSAGAGLLMREAICITDVERLAKAELPEHIWDFIAGGSGYEVTVAANRAALDSVGVIPRVLRDVSRHDMTCKLVNTPASMPVAVAPIAYQKLVHPEGELALARAAKEAGIPFTIATLSSFPLERIAEVGGSTWFQLYWLRDRGRCYELVQRAEDAGCEALVLTVDVPWMGRRLRDVRNQFVLPADITAANLHPGATSQAHQPLPGGSAVAVHTSTAFAPSLTWSDLEQLRSRTSLPLIVKGILAPDDAARAAAVGVDALVVSNHGGRQLDGAVASVSMLQAVCQAVAGHCQVLVDSGIRSGTDVLRALALGAAGVLVGRPLLWGLGTAGESGARHVLNLLAQELQDSLGLAGCSGITDARQLRTVRQASFPGPSQ